MHQKLVLQYVKALVSFRWTPFGGVQGFCFSQLGEGVLEDCGDQGLFLLLEAEEFLSNKLEIEGRGG